MIHARFTTNVGITRLCLGCVDTSHIPSFATPSPLGSVLNRAEEIMATPISGNQSYTSVQLVSKSGTEILGRGRTPTCQTAVRPATRTLRREYCVNAGIDSTRLSSSKRLAFQLCNTSHCPRLPVAHV